MRHGEAVLLVNLLNEVAQHLLRRVEVGDDTVLERANGHDGGGSPPYHSLGLEADGIDILRQLVDGDDGGLIDDDTFSLDHHQRVGRAQVNADIVGKKAQEGANGIEQQDLPVTS